MILNVEALLWNLVASSLGREVLHTSFIWLWKHFFGCYPIWQAKENLDFTESLYVRR